LEGPLLGSQVATLLEAACMPSDGLIGTITDNLKPIGDLGTQRRFAASLSDRCDTDKGLARPAYHTLTTYYISSLDKGDKRVANDVQMFCQFSQLSGIPMQRMKDMPDNYLKDAKVSPNCRTLREIAQQSMKGNLCGLSHHLSDSAALWWVSDVLTDGEDWGQDATSDYPRTGNDGVVSFESCRVKDRSDYGVLFQKDFYVIDGNHEDGTCRNGDGGVSRQTCTWIRFRALLARAFKHETGVWPATTLLEDRSQAPYHMTRRSGKKKMRHRRLRSVHTAGSKLRID